MTLTRIKVSAECEWKPGVDGEFYFASMVDAELEKARAELAAANASIAQLNDDLTEAAQVADADNETVAALVSRIEDEKVTALRAELAAARSQIVELNRIIAQWHIQLMESGE